MAVYFVGMESTAGYGLLAGQRLIADNAAAARNAGEALFLDTTIPADTSAEDREWLELSIAGRAPRIAAGYRMTARKVR